MRSKAYLSHSRESKGRRKAARIIIGSAAALVIILIVFPHALGTGSHASQDQNTTTTTTPLSNIQSTYEAVYSEYNVALVSADAVIATTGADITMQENRIENDAKTFNYNESGDGCSGNPSEVNSCLSDEQVTAQSALGDENAAAGAEKTDVTKQVRSVHQIENAITAFVQQLYGIPWPSSVSLVPLSLAHALTDSRGGYAQLAIDIASGKSITTDSQTIAATGSAVVMQLTDMASALDIPPPSSTTS